MVLSRNRGFLVFLTASVVLGVVAWCVGVSTPAQAFGEEEKHRHPHLHVALHELKEARKELKEADHDFGGHREASLKSVDHAIEQLEKALKFVPKK